MLTYIISMDKQIIHLQNDLDNESNAMMDPFQSCLSCRSNLGKDVGNQFIKVIKVAQFS